MRLEIHTMRKTIFTGETSRLSLPTVTGEVTILDNHEPYITVLAQGKLKYETTVGEQDLEIHGGFLEVRPNNNVRVLAD